MADEPQEKSGGGLSIQTLLISAGAAVGAATIVPLFWERGTLIATAMTPVVVALVSEALRKPVERVSAVTPKVARRSGTGAALRRPDPAAARTRDPERVGARGAGPERFEPLPEHRRHEAPAVSGDDPFGLRKAQRQPRPRLKIALITGALAFVIAAAVVTASELAIFDGSVAGDRKTSLFGGRTDDSRSSERDRDAEATATATPGGEEAATPTPEPGETPAPTPSATVTPEATATPAPTQAAPAPTATP
jgi:hypothetical protein